MKEGVDVVIVSPHPDDEIIGCYDVLSIKEISPIIIYTEELDSIRKKELLKLKDFVNIKTQLFLPTVPPILLEENNIFYFPDPIYETHPAHRGQGAIGEHLVRKGFNVIFYNTNMTAPYIYELEEPTKKKDLLNSVYPSQKDLWKYDHRYFLFEGYNQWLF